MVATAEPCWRCGVLLYLVSPPIMGWRYHCGQCQMLTSPSADLGRAMAARPDGSLGICAGIDMKVESVIEPEPSPERLRKPGHHTVDPDSVPP